MVDAQNTGKLQYCVLVPCISSTGVLVVLLHGEPTHSVDGEEVRGTALGCPKLILSSLLPKTWMQFYLFTG